MTNFVRILISLTAVMVTTSFESRASAETPVRLTIVVRPAVNLDEVSTPNSDEKSNANELTLAEIIDPATIPAESRAEIIRHLNSVALTDRPGVGEERSFTQEGLESIVGEASRRLETAGFAVEWKIPRRSQVTRKNPFTREAVLKKIEAEFATQCSGCEVAVRRLDLPPVGDARILSWKLAPRPERPRGSFAVPVDIEFSTGRKTMMISGQVEFFLNVPVATRAIQGGEKIAAADFKMDRRNITYSFDAPADTSGFENSVAARSLSAGETIWKATLRREQVLKFGDPVRVQVGGETWNVTTDGISQSTAALGDLVRVKVGKQQKLISGILKEKGLVEVQ